MVRKVAALTAVLLGVSASSAAAATINVTTTADVVANDGQCSLREAITAANTDTASGTAPGECPAGTPGGNNIVLPSGFYSLTGGELDVSSQITLVGQGPGATKVNANGLSRVLDVAGGGNLTVSDLTLTGGHAPDGANATSSAPAMSGGSGGAIDNAGNLTLEDVAVTGNQAGNGGNGEFNLQRGPQAEGDGGNGGAIESTGPSSSLSIVDSTIADNAAGNAGNGGVTITMFPTEDNGGGGGGIDASGGKFTIKGSTISDNRAGNAGITVNGSGFPGVGGGLYLESAAPATLENDTIAGDASELSPAVLVYASGTMNQVTITGTGNPGGCCDVETAGGLTISNSALDASCSAGVPDGGHNVALESGGCPGKQVSFASFVLGPLTSNGGPTETLLPGPGSALINEVPSRGAGCLPTDQRGVPRPQGRACDAGAVELRAGVATLHPARLNFGRTRLGRVRHKTVKLAYPGGELPLVLGRAKVTGRDALDFRIVKNRCRGKSLSQTQSPWCTLIISFRPSEKGRRSAKVTIAGAPVRLALTGTGVT